MHEKELKSAGRMSVTPTEKLQLLCCFIGGMLPPKQDLRTLNHPPPAYLSTHSYLIRLPDIYFLCVGICMYVEVGLTFRRYPLLPHYSCK